MKKITLEKVVRVVTLAPLLALLSLTILLVARPEAYNSAFDYALAVFFLTVLPLLAYPIQPLVPRFRDKGRDGQRQLAIVVAVIGYVAGIIFAVALKMTAQMILMFLTYLLSGVLVVLFNNVLKVKASGHACGVAGPIAYLTYFLGAEALWGVIILAFVYWASLKMERHTWSELFVGTTLPVAALAIAAWIVRIF